jgi:hypothetical protein
MTRILGILLLLVILRLAVKSFSAQFRISVLGAPPQRRPVAEAPKQGATETATETLLPCAACGVYVPATRALKAAGGGAEVFCSEECRTRGA